MVQSSSETSRLPKHRVAVPSCGLCLTSLHNPSCKRKRTGKLSKAKKTKWRKVAIYLGHDDPASNADNRTIPIDNAKASQDGGSQVVKTVFRGSHKNLGRMKASSSSAIGNEHQIGDRSMTVADHSDEGKTKPKRKAYTFSHATESSKHKDWKPLIEEADYFNGSFNCYAKLDKVIADLHKYLTDTQKEMFRRSSFAFLLDIDPSRLRWSPQLVRSILFRQVAHPSNEEMWFRLGKNVVKFGKLEWALITGLKFDGQMIRDCDLPPGERLKHTYFPNMQKGISKNMLRYTFLTITQISDDDRVKLALAYAIEHLFFAKHSERNIDPFILKIVDHMDLFNEHPWGLVTYKFTLQELLKTMKGKAQRVRKKKSLDLDKKVRVGLSLHGFPQALQVWAYEIIPSLSKQFAEKTHKDNIPRILCWTAYGSRKFDTLQKFVFKMKELHVTPLKPSASERRQYYSRGLCSSENAADSKGPGQKGEYEIEVDPTYDDEPINGPSASNENQVVPSSGFTNRFSLFRNELLQFLLSNEHRQGKTAKKDFIPKKQMEMLTHLASLMRTDVEDENQDQGAAGKHKRAPKEVSPTRVSQSLKPSKGQSSDAKRKPTEEAIEEAGPLDDKQYDEARLKSSENKRVRLMKTVVKMVQGKRSPGMPAKEVRSHKVNKNLVVSPWTLKGAETCKQLLTRRQVSHDALDDNAVLSPIYSNIKLMVGPPSKTALCFQQNEVDNSTNIHNSELLGLEKNEVSLTYSSHKNLCPILHSVKVEDSRIKGQEGAIESDGKNNITERGLEVAADFEPLSSSQRQDMSTLSADIRVAESMELESPESLMTVVAKSLEENGAKDNTSLDTDITDIQELQHGKVSAIRGQGRLQESVDKHDKAEKGFELPSATEPSSGFQHQNISISVADDGVTEEIEATRRVVDPTRSISKAALCADEVINGAKNLSTSGADNGRIVENLSSSRFSESGLFVGETTENDESFPTESTRKGCFDAVGVEDYAITGLDGVEESSGNADNSKKEHERAAATEPPSGSHSNNQNVSISAADKSVVEDIETTRPVVDPMTSVSKSAMCTNDVNIEVKSQSSSSANGRVAENTDSATLVIDLTNEESGTEIREIPGLELEARIRRLEKILKYVKKIRYPHLYKDK